MQEQKPQTLSSTVPVFDANKLTTNNASIPVVPIPPKPPTEPPVPNAPQKRLPVNLNLILILGGAMLFLILIFVFVKIIIPGGSQSKQAKLVWWGLAEDAASVTPIIQQYEQANPGITIEFVAESQQDYQVRLANALSKDQGPDIFEFHNTWVPMYASILSSIPTTVYSETDFAKTFYPVMVSNLRTRSGLVGIPLQYDGISLFINRDIFQAYGKNDPKTWDDLRKYAQDLTIRDTNGNIKQSGAALGVTANVDYWQDIFGLLALQNGVDLSKPNGAQGVSALTFYTDFSKVDHVWDETLPTSTIDFATGHLAMYFGPYYQVANIKSQNPSLHFNVIPLPQLPQASPNISYASYWVNGVSNKSSNQMEAWKFLKFMSSQVTLRQLYQNEVKSRGYGNLYPRVDMQSELLSDPFAGPFIFQASYAQSWYLVSNTFDGATGINTQISKLYSDAIAALNLQSTADMALQSAQTQIQQVLSSYGLVAIPTSTGQ